jgi:16S rRNA (guanine966-N2)-methyltransferase
LRIVAGKWRGRHIEAPEGPAVRPTLDRVREAWMSILSLDLPHARVVDLFSGSGALGLEALSRGAESADFIEKDPRSIRFLKANIETLGADAVASVTKADAILFAETLAEKTYDVAFADPPYDGGFAVRLATLWLARPFASILSVEHKAGEKMPGATDTRRYGTSAVTFYRTED